VHNENVINGIKGSDVRSAGGERVSCTGGKMAGYPEPVEKKFYDFFWLWI
jgi:hypothetical protein